MVGYNMDGPARDRVLKIFEKKDRIEREIRENTAILEVNNVGMNEPLVDAHGYPRNDIDVYKVRHARHRIICLQNDHKAIMRRIEQSLTELHSQFLGPQGEGSGNAQENVASTSMTNGYLPTEAQSSGGNTTNTMQYSNGFATVTFVHDGSPADLAGLSKGDEIIKFGSINPDNFVDLPQIYDLVSHSIGQSITVQVRRSHNLLNLSVVPRPWAQPGMLGCQINRRVES